MSLDYALCKDGKHQSPARQEYSEPRQHVIRLLPSDLSYYRYAGSLTAPPCTEGAKWILLQRPVELSAEQLAQLKALYAHNVRPVQPLNGRRILVGE